MSQASSRFGKILELAKRGYEGNQAGDLRQASLHGLGVPEIPSRIQVPGLLRVDDFRDTLLATLSTKKLGAKIAKARDKSVSVGGIPHQTTRIANCL